MLIRCFAEESHTETHSDESLRRETEQEHWDEDHGAILQLYKSLIMYKIYTNKKISLSMRLSVHSYSTFFYSFPA